MRCRIILLISEHPIEQGIRKGGGPHFCNKDEDEEEWRNLVVGIFNYYVTSSSLERSIESNYARTGQDYLSLT